jgi:S1-C subfamily serine protease
LGNKDHATADNTPVADPRVPGFLGRVLDEFGQPEGTCFQLFTGVVITAAHVLAAVGSTYVGSYVTIDPLGGGRESTGTVAGIDHTHDLAVLTFSDSPLHESAPELLPTDSTKLLTSVRITGVVHVADDVVYRFLDATGIWAGGTLRGNVMLGRLSSRDVLRGMSGAPVVAEGGIVGVVSARYNSADGWLRDSVWIARTEDILALAAKAINAQESVANNNSTMFGRSQNPSRDDSAPQESVAAIYSEADIRLGVGFFVAPKTIFTARNVLTNLEIGAKYGITSGGGRFSARLVAVPAELDLAILETSRDSQSWLPFDRSPAIGDRLIALGSAPGQPASLMAKLEGVTKNNRARLLEFWCERPCDGLTGAPLYNLDRRGVCGVITSARYVSTGYGGRAISVASAIELLPTVRAIAWEHTFEEGYQSHGSATTSEQIRVLAKEVLAGDVIIVLGDVLDSSGKLGREAVEGYLRRELSTLADDDSKRVELLKYLRSESRSANPLYETLARLPISTIVSLHPDARLEQALHSYRIVTLGEDLQLAELSAGKRELYLLGGSVLFGKGLILNQDDRDDLREHYNRLHQGFRQALAMVPILFMGCDFADWTTKRLLWDILRHRTALDGKLFSANSGSSSKPAIPGETTVIDMTPGELLGSLEVATSGRRPIEVRTWVDQIPVARGFRYLDHFTENDRGAFYARERECHELLAVVLSAQSKISVLCGRSGAGKTSLALAGLKPILQNETHMRVEYVRSTADPLQALESTLSEITGNWSDYSLADDHAFEQLRERLLRIPNPILLVFDQLEETFVKGGRRTTTEFLTTIRRMATFDWLPIRFLLISREDFLHELAGNRTSSISTLASVYRLADFDHAAASDVVRRTAATMGWECEPGFVRAMLEDLSPETISPSNLQIVCHRVQQESAQLKKLSASIYTRLGRASEILRSHIDNALQGLPGTTVRQIKTILGVMVTSSDTKFMLSDAEIASRSGLSQQEVDDCLLDLVHRHRLVREIQLDEVRYELTHESLVPTVLEWLDASDHKLRTVQDIVDQEVVVGRRVPGHVISVDRLTLVSAVLDQLNLNEDALSLVASSFCVVSGEVPGPLVTRVANLSKRRQIESLWIRPVFADSHQFEAVLRSPVSEILPLYDASDLPDSLLSRASEAIRSADDQIFQKLLSFLRLSPALESSALQRVANDEAALRSLIDSAQSDLLPSLARYAGRSETLKAPSMRLGLRLILEHTNRWAQSASEAAESVKRFFDDVPQRMRRADAVRVVSEFLADGSRPQYPAIFGAAVCAIARRGSRPSTSSSELSNREAALVLDAIATAQPGQLIAVCAGLLDDLLESDPRQPSLSALGHLALVALNDLSGNTEFIDTWFERDVTAPRLLARMLGWAMNLDEFRKMPAARRLKIDEAVGAFRFGPDLSYRLNDVILSGWEVSWVVDQPTKDELQELEEALGPNLRIHLLEDLESLEEELEYLEGLAETRHDDGQTSDEVSDPHRLETELQLWYESGQEDPADDVLDEARRKLEWIDRGE